MENNAMEFEGWVENILPAGDYDQKFSVATYRDKEEKQRQWDAKQFPNVMMFTANAKNGANGQLDDLRVGDKIRVKYYIVGRSGVSKSTGSYYCINSLSIPKANAITILQRAMTQTKIPNTRMPEYDNDADGFDIPF